LREILLPGLGAWRGETRAEARHLGGAADPMLAPQLVDQLPRLPPLAPGLLLGSFNLSITAALAGAFLSARRLVPLRLLPVLLLRSARPLPLPAPRPLLPLAAIPTQFGELPIDLAKLVAKLAHARQLLGEPACLVVLAVGRAQAIGEPIELPGNFL